MSAHVGKKSCILAEIERGELFEASTRGKDDSKSKYHY